MQASVTNPGISPRPTAAQTAPVDIYAIRKANLVRLVRERSDGNQSACARAIGRPPSLVNRYLGDKKIGDDIARAVETGYKLPVGWMDQRHDAPPREGSRVTMHGISVSREAMLLAREWEKLDPPVQAQVQALIETLAASKIRADKKRRSSAESAATAAK